jgi:molybdopterin-guanine dinucleotide biosynthesis protein A
MTTSMPDPAVQPRYPRDDVTGVILAGGLARRMGGVDKGLVELAGRPMVEHVLAALRPQVGPILINANRNLDRYSAYGYPVIDDTLPGYLGPLAGVLSAMQRLATGYLVTVPCDAPRLAPDLVSRLFDAGVTNGADVAVATDGRRQQPVFLLLRAGLTPALESYLAGGGRRVDTWLARLRLVEADFSDAPDTFINVNDPAERQRLEAALPSATGLH